MICRICQAREASCRITERQADGSYRETRCCEPCLHETVPDAMLQPTALPSVDELTRMISGLHVLGGPAYDPDQAARAARAFVDQWEKRNPPPHRPG